MEVDFAVEMLKKKRLAGYREISVYDFIFDKLQEKAEALDISINDVIYELLDYLDEV